MYLKNCLLFRAWGHQRRETSKKEWKKEGVSCISGNTLRESSSVKLIFVNRLGLYTNPVWAPHLSSCSTTTSYWPILLPSAPRGREMFLLTHEGSSSLPDVCYWDNLIVPLSVWKFPKLHSKMLENMASKTLEVWLESYLDFAGFLNYNKGPRRAGGWMDVRSWYERTDLPGQLTGRQY